MPIKQILNEQTMRANDVSYLGAGEQTQKALRLVRCLPGTT